MKNLPPHCVTEALKLCLSYNNFVLNNTNYLETEGRAQGSHMSCFYADITMT